MAIPCNVLLLHLCAYIIRVPISCHIYDLKDMYTVHQGKPDILLWAQRCDATRKRAHTPDEETAKRTRYDKYLDKMTEVEMIEEELKGKHTDDQYTDEQIRSWAHLIQMKKHSSYDCPPNKRFWKVA